MRFVLVLSVLVGGGLLAPVAAWGQATAQIGGVVHDESGSIIPGAEIKVTQTATGATRTTSSGNDGGYVLPNLPIGPYLVEVTKAGFNKYVQTGIVLQVDANPTIDVSLKVGTVNEQVTVEANAAQVETRSTGIGQVVDNQRVAEMPLNGRNPIELVFLAGMASFPGNGAVNTVRNYPTVVVSVAGGQANSVSYLLDGTVFQDPYNNLALPLPFPDALQEFKVETSALQAQYGYHSGASVSGVTKSGTNEFHGNLFEFLRNGNLNARNFFASARDTLKRNQFGGVIGGPIIKDKLFFFAGYQRTAQRSDPSQNIAFIPTAAMLQGDFTAVTAAACQNNRPITLSAASGFTGNRISPALLSPVTVAVAKTLPQTSDPCGRTVFGLVANQEEDLPVGRLDWQKSQNHTLFARATFAKLHQDSTYDGVNPLSISAYGVNDFNYQIALGSTYLIGSSVVNSVRLSASRTNVAKFDDVFKSWRDFGANFTDVGGKVIRATITGGGNFLLGGPAAVPGESHNGPNPSISDDVSWIRGSHQLGFGGNLYHQRMNYWSGINATGNVAFNGTVTAPKAGEPGFGSAGLGAADFLLGQAVTFAQGTTYGFYNRQYYASLYVQDSWRAKRGLTINYGVRWEPYTSPYSKYGQIHHFVPERFAAGAKSTVYQNAPAGVIFPGDAQYTCGNNYNCNVYTKFFPRLGIAWDPTGSGKMTIRAAYGLYGDRNHMFFPNQMTFGPPFGSNVAQTNVNIGDPWAAYPGGNPIPGFTQAIGIGVSARNAPFPTAGNYVSFPLEGFKPMYVNQWNLSIQRQLGDWLLTANYLGNSQIHTPSSATGNPAVFIPGNCTTGTVTAACSTTNNQNQRRQRFLQDPVQGRFFAAIGQSGDGGTVSYNGFYVSANKRLKRGVTLNTNYTWSHCIGDQFDQQTTPDGVPNIPGNRGAYRGNCTGSDQRHQYVLNMVASTPKFANKALRIIASDWQVSPILQIKSAQFYTITDGTDRALTTAPGQTGNWLGTEIFPAEQSVNRWMNPTAFQRAPLGTYGTLGYNNMKGPGAFQLNMGLARNFRYHERYQVQLRGEAFNLPNKLNAGNPVSALNASNFGQIINDVSGNNGQSPGNQRIVQLALKFLF